MGLLVGFCSVGKALELNVGFVHRTCQRMEIRTGEKKMKIGIALLCSVGLLAPTRAQENHATSERVAPSIGLEIGQRAPAFALSDQFGHEQSNETLKGSKGTVLLFFRSADW
jgi:hypothetical protein